METQTIITYATYEDFVKSRFKPGADILATLTPEKLELWNAATLWVNEADELLDAVKKHVIYNKPLDKENVAEELGDLEFARAAFYATLEKFGFATSPGLCAYMNQVKLEKRYPKGYSDAAAQAREDKKP